MKYAYISGICLFTALLLAPIHAQPLVAQSQQTPLIVINEVAWSGTTASSSDEWIELRNNSSVELNLTGWTLTWGTEENQRVIHFSGDEEESNTINARTQAIRANGFYLLERTDDETIRDIDADLIYSGSLRNSGEVLELRNADGDVVSTANIAGGEWPAGTSQGDVPYASMERINSSLQDSNSNWGSNNGVTRSGRDSDGNLINGTPKAENSRSN